MKTVIYLHIPKAAGSTFSEMLRLKYQGQNMVQLLGESGELEAFKAQPAAKRQDLKLVMGHFPYGLHRVLPGECTYLTVLRHPVDRVVSHYYFILRHQNNYLHQRVTQEAMSLEEFIDSQLTWELDNLQTRMLGDGMSLRFGQVGQDNLDLAKERLRNMDLVGLVEEPHKTLVMLKKTLGWRTVPRVGKVNVTRNRPKLADVAPEVVRKIEKLNNLDMALYQEAARLLDARFKEAGRLWARQEKFYRCLDEQPAPKHKTDTCKAYGRAALAFIK